MEAVTETLERSERPMTEQAAKGIRVDEKSGDLLFSAIAVDKNKKPNRNGWIFDWDKPSDVLVKNWQKNPVLLYQHSNGAFPIGWVDEVEVTDKAVLVEARIPNLAEDPELAAYDEVIVAQVRGAVRAGLIRAVSIGFYLSTPTESVEGDERAQKIKSFEIVELSIVTIGAHETALIKQDTGDPTEMRSAAEKFFGRGHLEDAHLEGRTLYRLSFDEIQASYHCECLDCSHQMVSKKHCREIKCPKCGGEMRRVERPGPGQRADATDQGQRDSGADEQPGDTSHPPTDVETGNNEPAAQTPAPEGEEGDERMEAAWRGIAYSRHGDKSKAPEGAPWDGPAEVRKADVDDLKMMCAVEDSEALDTKRSYKLPHHRKSGYVVVWRGVAAAMGVLLGARGGLKGVPTAAKKAAHGHLKKHYAQFDKDAPDFKQYPDEELRQLHEEGLIIVPGMPLPGDGQGLNERVESLAERLDKMEMEVDTLRLAVENDADQTPARGIADPPPEGAADSLPISPETLEAVLRETARSVVQDPEFATVRQGLLLKAIERAKKPNG